MPVCAFRWLYMIVLCIAQVWCVALGKALAAAVHDHGLIIPVPMAKLRTCLHRVSLIMCVEWSGHCWLTYIDPGAPGLPALLHSVESPPYVCLVLRAAGKQQAGPYPNPNPNSVLQGSSRQDPSLSLTLTPTPTSILCCRGAAGRRNRQQQRLYKRNRYGTRKGYRDPVLLPLNSSVGYYVYERRHAE